MFHRRTLFLAAVSAMAAVPAFAAPLTLPAADGVQVWAEHRTAAGTRRGIVLLFHQAGTNHGEYDPIAPRLNRMGFDTLAIDQRSGGTAFGHRNETAERVGRDPGYLAALPDLEAAFAWAQSQKVPVVVWGSSYSAALVFLLASRPPGGIAALLAFSPGEYIGGVSIRSAAAKVACPVFATSAGDPGEEAAAAEILAAAPSPLKRQIRSPGGVHGSSTLRRANADDVWQGVEVFLDQAIPRA